MSGQPVDVQFDDVSHWFGAPPHDVQALRRVAFTVRPGEFVCLVGPSGCGKSTLLRLAAGLAAPTAGEIRIANSSPQQLRAQKEIGWMAQQPALLPWRTVLQNVALPLHIKAGGASADPPAQELLRLVGLSDFADAYPYTLSGGMQQRAALARTLATGARLWLMDEPFAALDELTREALAGELLAIWRQVRPTVLWVTHSLTEAARLADRIVLLSPRPGTVVETLPVDLPRPRDDTSAALQGIVRAARRGLRVGDWR